MDHEVPLVAKAQVRMLAQGVTDAAPPAASVPEYLTARSSPLAREQLLLVRERTLVRLHRDHDADANSRLRHRKFAPVSQNSGGTIRCV